MSARREEEAGPRQRKADGSDQRTGARAGDRQCDLCRHRRPTTARPMCCRRSRKRGDWRFLFLLKFHHHRFWARTVPGRAHPLEVLMSQQLFSRYPADVVEHGKLGAHLALLMPPLAALLYPFLLAAFHANIAPVI